MHTLSSDLVRSVLDSAPDVMVLTDAEGRILFVNRQFCSVFGYDREEVRGQPVEVLIPQRFRNSHVGHRARFASENLSRPMGAELELFAQRKDGTEFSVEISLSPVQDHGTRLVAAAIRDVTQRKREQQELVAARQAAEKARLVADAARETADRANQAKGRFLATASHDLRQPLQSLSLLNGALRRVVEHPDALEVLAHQDQAIATMSRLLNTLLDISKLDAGVIKADPADFNVGELFAELEGEFAQVASQKGLRLRVAHASDAIHCDRALLGQVLRNLLANAIKYTHSGTVRLASRREETALWIEVIDTGIGIAADHLKLIFDEFYQVGVPTNSSREGYGLGLSIVQRLIALLGIEIQVRSEPDKGSVFSLRVPLGRTAPAATAGRAGSAGGARPATTPVVLLVEDDPAVRDATRLLLKVEGYRVLTASCLTDARSMARSHPELDLLVTDYHLSAEETGTQVITAVREDLGRRVKAVLITGDTSAAVKELQQDERLKLARKPIHADELLGLLKTMLTV